jgi:chemotaxis protein MotB
MLDNARALIGVVAEAIGDLPNRLSIRGHTDARPFASGARYDNWRLSSDRANATREALVEAGLPASRIADVIGKGPSEPLFPDDPADARNRRISLVLLRDATAPAAGAQGGG